MKIVCTVGHVDDANLRNNFPMMKEFHEYDSCLFYYGWDSQRVENFPKKLHEKHVRRNTASNSVVIWARYYQTKDEIMLLKKELKKLLLTKPENYMEKVKETRATLEKADEAIEKYEPTLAKLKIDFVSKKKEKKKAKTE
jgi:hypothetical protein